MAESQNHGFLIEADVLRSAMCQSPPEAMAYNAPVDSPAGHSAWSLNPGFPIQVKSAKARSARFVFSAASHAEANIGLADAMRCIGCQGVEVIVGVWEQSSPGSKSMRAYHRMLFSAPSWAKLFGTLGSAELGDFCAEVKRKPPEGCSRQAFDAATATLHAKARGIEASHGMAAKLRVKIDSKGQRRVQLDCALSRLMGLADSCESFSAPQFPALRLSASFQTPRRSRAPKPHARLASPSKPVGARRSERFAMVLGALLGASPETASPEAWARASARSGIDAPRLRRMLSSSITAKTARLVESALKLSPLAFDAP